MIDKIVKKKEKGEGAAYIGGGRCICKDDEIEGKRREEFGGCDFSYNDGRENT